MLVGPGLPRSVLAFAACATLRAVKLWQNLWLLVAVIWGVVAALQVGTILAFADESEAGKALQPALLGVAVPVLLYAAGWAWERVASRKKPKD